MVLILLSILAQIGLIIGLTKRIRGLLIFWIVVSILELIGILGVIIYLAVDIDSWTDLEEGAGKN